MSKKTKPERRTIMFRCLLTRSEAAALARLAVAQGVSMSGAVRMALLANVRRTGGTT